MTAPILMAALCSFWGCDKDEDHLSEAVLASANTLNFEAERAAEKFITIYADADWVTEVPDWVTVTPDSGTGVMDVTVSVTDNMRDGAEDNPRKATLVFKGRTLASRAQVLITQNGDKYRDVKEYTAGELAALADETVISVPSAIVVAVTTKGFVISDDKNTDNIFVSDATTVAVGDKISLLGTKSSDSQKLATVIDCDEVTVLSGGAVNYPEPEDISAKIDDYTSSKRGYVTVKGVFNGSTPHRFGARQVLGPRRGRTGKPGPFRPDRPYRNRHRLLRRFGRACTAHHGHRCRGQRSERDRLFHGEFRMARTVFRSRQRRPER